MTVGTSVASALPAAALLLARTLAPDQASAQDLTIALSTQEIAITSNFTGGDVTLFGVIERDPSEDPPVEYKVVVKLLGPSQNVVVRRKDRVLGVWINRASETVLAAPSFYAVRSSIPLTDIAEEEVLREHFLGIHNIGLVYRGKVVVNDPSSEEFRQAFLRLKAGAGLYSEAAEVELIGDSIFRARISVPASVPVGQYTATAHLFADGQEVASALELMRVTRTGSERLLFDLSRGQSLLYGLATVLLALFVGWLGGVLFRRD